MYDWLITHTDQANAIGTITSAAIAAFAFCVAVASVYYTHKGLKSQQKHNALSVLPVPFIALADYENLIRVKIRNDGLGPLFIEGIDIIDGEKVNEYDNLVSYLPQPPSSLAWSNFSSGYVRSIRPGDDLVLIEIEIHTAEKPNVIYREILRKRLSALKISVRYTCAYGNAFAPIERDLAFFARRLSSSKIGAKK